MTLNKTTIEALDRMNLQPTDGYLPKTMMCDDPQDGGCGEFFVREISNIIIKTSKIEGRGGQ